jgi:hypothetical protein
MIDGTTSLDVPVDYGSGDPLTLSDIIQGETDVSRADFVDLAAALYQDPWVMGIIDAEVQKGLSSPQQKALWDAIRQNPEFLKIQPDKVGVDARALAKEISETLGTEYVENRTDKAVGKLFRTKVWPAMSNAMEDPSISERLLKKKHILEVVQDATRRRDKGKEHMGPIYPAGEAPLSLSDRRKQNKNLHGPFDRDPNMEVEGPPVPRESPDWIKKLRSNPDFRALGRLASSTHLAQLQEIFNRRTANKVAALWWMNHGPIKKAWRLPADQRALYLKAKRWAENNLATYVFETHKGMQFNTDGLAYGIARHLGQPKMKDDPTHWVYEIAYDMERAARREGLHTIKGRAASL